MSRLLEPPAPATPSESICLLENGDHLNAEEFRRRYAAMPRVKKAELLQGVVYMPSPVRLDYHATPHSRLQGWLAVYEAFTPGVISGDNGSMLLDEWNEPQADACLLIDPARGGQSRVVDGYLTGAPELVAEVAASSVSYDLHKKKAIYAGFGVREYIVWRVLDRAIDWFILKGDDYEPLAADADGIYRSPIFPGLWLAARALLEEDLARVHAVLQQGLADPVHAAFLRDK